MIQDPGNVLPFRENNPERKNLRSEAARWIADNPAVFGLFDRFALQMLAKRRRFGISLLTERVRWEVLMNWARDARGFKINNNWAPYYVRMFVADFPQHELMFAMRESFADEGQRALFT